MAKIVSPVWSSIRGSICGTTYLTTSAGVIIGRQRCKPVNRRSTLQTLVRSSLSGASAAWRAADPAERSGWDNYAITAGYRMGREAFFAGYTLAKYLNNRFAIGIALVDTPPEQPSKYDLFDVTVTPTSTPGEGVDLQFTTTDTQAGTAFFVVSPGFSPSRRHWTGPWDQLKTGFVSIPAAGSFVKQIDGVAGLRYFVRVIVAESDDSLRVSSAWIANGVAAVNP